MFASSKILRIFFKRNFSHTCDYDLAVIGGGPGGKFLSLKSGKKDMWQQLEGHSVV